MGKLFFIFNGTVSARVIRVQHKHAARWKTYVLKGTDPKTWVSIWEAGPGSFPDTHEGVEEAKRYCEVILKMQEAMRYCEVVVKMESL